MESIKTVRGPEPCPCCNNFHFHDKRNVVRMKEWADQQLDIWAKEMKDYESRKAACIGFKTDMRARCSPPCHFCAAPDAPTQWVTQCCRRTVKLDDPNPPYIVYCPECESQDAFAVPATGDDEPEISNGCSEMHGPRWKDLSELEEKIDALRTRDREFRRDLFTFLKMIERGFPVKGELCLNDLIKKYT